MPSTRDNAAIPQANDKCMWTLVRPEGTGTAEFQHYVLNDLAKVAGGLFPGTTGVWVTLQDPNAWSSALVMLGGVERRVDAVLQITSSTAYAATDEVNSVLSGNSGHVQGWRIHQTPIFDWSEPVPLGQPYALPQYICMVERIDGTSADHFNRNWYMHGGRRDGQEAESDESRAVHAEWAKNRKGLRYLQNRVIEAVTPTSWVVNGYTELLEYEHWRSAGDRYDATAGMGEEHFMKWPPRLLQGPGYRVM